MTRCGMFCNHHSHADRSIGPLRPLLDLAYRQVQKLLMEPTQENLERLLVTKREFSSKGYRLQVFENGTVGAERIPNANKHMS